MTMWLVGLMTVVKICISRHWSHGGLLILKDDCPNYKKIKGVVLRRLEGFISVCLSRRKTALSRGVNEVRVCVGTHFFMPKATHHIT